MNKIFIKRKCKKCKYVVSLTGKQPTHCGLNALSLKDTRMCKIQKEYHPKVLEASEEIYNIQKIN